MGFPYGDIIVIGAIAAFIILRYRAMLGEKSGRDADATPAARPLQEYERVIQLPERAKTTAPEQNDYGALTDTIAAMRAIDRQFTLEEFMEGARGAYEMVIDAYNSADRETLKMLLAKDIYTEFDRTLSSLQADGKTAHTTLVAIKKAMPTDASLSGSKARITVHFTTEQVPLVRNAAGEILEGNASREEVVEDTWMFERNLTSSDPSWKVIET